MPRLVPESNKKECRLAGTEVNFVDGLIDEAGRQAKIAADERGLFELSTLKEPYRAEGKKTMGLEIAMQLGTGRKAKRPWRICSWVGGCLTP